eukprot:74210_1
MVASNVDYALVITIVYATVYLIVFLIVSVICALKIRNIRRHKKQVSNDTNQIKIAESGNNTEEKEEQKKEENRTEITMTTTSETEKKEEWYKPIKEWFVLMQEKRKVYLSLIPHIFDQATDYGVIYTYYSLWQNNK